MAPEPADNTHVLDRLGAYLDEELDSDSAERVASHVAKCEACRRALDDFIALRGEAGGLVRDIPPTADLWPGVSARLGSSRHRSPWIGLAVAASVLVSVGGGWWASSRVTTPDSQVAQAPALSAIEQLDAEYGRAIATLQAVRASSEPGGSPVDRAALDRDLEVLDEALAQIHEAVRRSPGNPVLLDMLRFVYEQKRQTLERAIRVSVPARKGT